MDEQSEPAGQRLWKWAAATALALGTLLLLVAGLAGPAYRVGIAELPTAIDLVIWGARIGIPVMVLSLVATVLAMALKRKREWPAFALAALFCGIIVFGALQQQSNIEAHPPIHDVTTDLAEPPAFAALDPLAGDSRGVPARSEELEAMSEEQRWRTYHAQFYGDLLPLVLDMEPADALAEAEAVARDMGWEIAATAPEDGRIEATATTTWFGFKDDVVIRVRALESGGSRLDVRSVSRIGTSDLGTNAERIRTFIDRLEARTGAAD